MIYSVDCIPLILGNCFFNRDDAAVIWLSVSCWLFNSMSLSVLTRFKLGSHSSVWYLGFLAWLELLLSMSISVLSMSISGINFLFFLLIGSVLAISGSSWSEVDGSISFGSSLESLSFGLISVGSCSVVT